MSKHVLGIAIVGIGIAGIAWSTYSLLGQESHNDDHAHPHTDEQHNDVEHTLVAREPVRQDGEFTITTSFYPLQFALEQVTGGLATVINIGEGQDPHDFQPTTADVLALQQADLVVLQGAAFEPWQHDVEDQLATDEVPLLVVTDTLPLRAAGAHDHGHEHEESESHTDEHHESETEHHEEVEHKHHNHGDYDPHTWLDPVLFSETVETIATALATLDPDNAAIYETNAATLQAELAQLNTAYETALNACELSEVITSHDAFGYVGERYGFEIHAIAGLSTQDRPSADTMGTLVEEAAEGITTILLEENSVTAYGETIAAETGLATLPINPIAYVIPEDEDYLSIMRSNLNTFKTALSCN